MCSAGEAHNKASEEKDEKVEEKASQSQAATARQLVREFKPQVWQ